MEEGIVFLVSRGNLEVGVVNIFEWKHHDVLVT